MAISATPDPTTLPDEPLFRRMMANAIERPSHVLISDRSVSVEADSVKVFADLLHMRNAIRQRDAAPDSYISVLMPVNYEFIITALAVLASDQAFAPIRFGSPAEYALGLMRRCSSTCLVYGTLERSLAIEMQELAAAQGSPIQIVPFEGSPESPPQLEDLHFCLDAERAINPDRPAMLVYSSGTTSDKPKGIIHNRRFFDRPGHLAPQAIFLMIADPVQAISSLNILAIPLSTGCQMRFIPRAGAVPEVWEQFRTGRISAFTSIPDTWNEMAWYYRNRIQHLPQETRDSYLAGARRVMFPYTKGNIAPAAVLRFWKEELKRPLHNVFGATEVGGMALCTSSDTVSEDYQCIGKPKPKITVKLSEGDHGELLIKSPTMMSGYLHDPERTKSVFDEEGFYRTGDLVHLSPEGEYIYERRISKPTKDPVLVMKQTLSALPYIQNSRVEFLPWEHVRGSHMLGLIVSIRPPTASSTEKHEYMSDCLRRLQVVLSLAFLQLDHALPLAACVRGEEDKAVWEKKQLRDVFPYQEDPGFRADYEIGVHRAWMN